MNQTDTELLKQIAGMDGVPEGAYNIRKDGGMDSRRSTETIEITSKEDKPGIDIRIKAGTKGQDVHIPVLLTQSGLNDLVYNDFFIGEDCDVDIIAGDIVRRAQSHLGEQLAALGAAQKRVARRQPQQIPHPQALKPGGLLEAVADAPLGPVADGQVGDVLPVPKNLPAGGLI